MPQVSVDIDGKTYRMACGEGEEDHLIQLAERFDRTLQDLKGAFGPIGDQRLTVMAGISIVDRLHEAERRIASLEARMSGDGSDGRSEDELAEAIETAARRIDRLAVKLRSLQSDEVGSTAPRRHNAEAAE